MYHYQVKKESRPPSVEFSWSICIDFRWSIPVTLLWAVIVTSAVATRCGARSTAPSSRHSRTCLTRQRSTPCLSFSWPGHRWLTWTWRHMARWAPFTRNMSNICSLFDLGMRRVGGRCYCSLCDYRSLYYYIVFYFIWCLFQVELIEVKKHLETRSKYVLNLQRKGLIKQVGARETTLSVC